MSKCSFPGCNSHEDRGGYCVNHAKYFAGAKPPKEKKAIPQQSEKKKQELKEQRPIRISQGDWFVERINEQTGVCMECGGSTVCTEYVYARMTVAHVLPKREDYGCPSVATHPDAALELCAKNGCHHKYDNSGEDVVKMVCWPIAVEKFKRIYPFIAQNERKNIPLVLLQEVEPISI